MQWVTNRWPAWPTTISEYYYQTGKTNINADALLEVSWPGCMPDNSGTHLQFTAARVWAVQKAAHEGPTSPIEAHSCDLHVLDSVQGSQQVAHLIMEDWHQAQQVDSTLSLVINRLQNGTLWQQQSKQTDPLELNQFLHEQNHLQLQKGVLYSRARPRESAQRSCSKGMPWWGWPSRPGANARPHTWLVLLASHGCSGKGAHWQVLPMPYLPGQAAQGPRMTSYMFLGLTHTYLNMQYIALIMYIFYLYFYIWISVWQLRQVMFVWCHCKTLIHRPFGFGIPSWFSCEWVSLDPCLHD